MILWAYGKKLVETNFPIDSTKTGKDATLMLHPLLRSEQTLKHDSVLAHRVSNICNYDKNLLKRVKMLPIKWCLLALFS